jgi:TRAP-type C4-dicarboxylate transport system substrate-binding protein
MQMQDERTTMMTSMSTGMVPVLLTLLLFLQLPATCRAQVVIKLGTVAPEGSTWHDALLSIRQQWRDISHGEVELRIYAGGVLGGEAEMVRKVQRHGLDAIAISGAGLPFIDSSVDCLNLPMLFESYEELDYVRNGIAPDLEQRLAHKYFKVLSWAEGGWIYFFTKAPVRTPDDLRKLRLWTAAGHPEAETLSKALGFQVVPLPETDMLTGLQTGLVDAIDVPPLFALLDRSYQLAKYMTNLKFAPLNAATVISLPAWERIPASHRPRLLDAVRQAGQALRAAIRQAGDDAIQEMRKRGLQIVDLDAPTIAQWRLEAQKAYPKFGCSVHHPDVFDKVLRLHQAFQRR